MGIRSFLERNKFISELREGVKTEETKRVVLNDKVYILDSIDRKIKISTLTKNGEQLYLYRNGIKSKQMEGHQFIRAQYFIIDSKGNAFGRIPVSINNPDTVSIDYWISEGQRGKGVGTVALEEVLKQIYDKKEFDNLEFLSINYSDTSRTGIKNIVLEINDDNEASKRIATKNGFKKSGENTYSLTSDEYRGRNRETSGDERIE